LKDKITEADKQQILTAVNATDQWLRSNPTASLEELQAQKTQLEAVYNPVMTKLYGQG